jgi:hypothetical protein
MSSLRTVESGGYYPFSATGNILPQGAAVRGIFVSAASGTPTLTVYDSASNTTTNPIVQTFTPVAGEFYEIPAMAMNGVYVVVGGTVSATLFADPQTSVG